MIIAVGSDFIAEKYKKSLIKYLSNLGHTIIDVAPNKLYPLVAFEVAQLITSHKCDRGILICGTGIGMSIAANKVPGIYAACVTTKYQAQRAVLSNNANILTLGCYNNSKKQINKLAKIFLTNVFDPTSPSQQKINEIYKYENL